MGYALRKRGQYPTAVASELDGLLAWLKTKIGGGVGATGALAIADHAVTYTKLQEVLVASRLLGRGSMGGGGDVQELTVGAGLTLSGTTLSAMAAAVKPFVQWTALDNQPPLAAAATADTRNAHPVLDFDGTTDEEAIFAGVLPTHYAGGGVTCEVWTAFTSATSGSVRFQAALERDSVSAVNLDSDDFAAFQSGGGTAPGTSGLLIKVSITFTNGAQMDSLQAGEAFRLKIRRDADGTSGTDNITTDAEVVRVVLRET